MSLNTNPGIFFILGFKGAIPDADFLDMIDEFPPSGFLLLEGNFIDLEQLTHLTSRLKSKTDGKCLIAVDQEPGRVQRFKAGFPVSKTPADYLRQGSTGGFREWCSTTAALLRSSGIDMNLAPVVDMLPAGKDYPVLKDRGFGDNPEKVSEFAEILIEEHKKKSVLTCAKHFPGLGSAINDPHLDLALSRESIERFRDHHWLPFAEAVKNGVDFVMTTHLLADAIDDEHCATYSERTIRHLRRATGHPGPVISDDLSMRGARAGREIGQAALNAIESGHNFIIISGDVSLQLKALKHVADRLNEDASLVRAANENEKIIEKIGRAVR